VSLSDAIVAALIVAAACWWLYRSLWKRGPCHGCSGGGGCHGRAAPPEPVVRIGRR
jgi:hypothetical protein